MAGPWEKYGGQASGAPWTKYGEQQAPAQPGYTFNPESRDGWLGTVDAGVRSAANMLTFGAADKLSALASPGNYDENLKIEDAINAVDAEKHPVAQTVGSVGGAVLPLLAGNPTGIARVYAPVSGGMDLAKMSLLGRMGANSADAALMGAAHGFISNNGDVGDKLASAAEEGATGAVIGAAVPAAVSGIRGVAGVVSDTAQRFANPGQRATDFLAGHVMRDAPDGISTIESAAKQALDNGQDVATIGSLAGRNTRKLGGVVARSNSEGADTVEKFYTQRDAGQGGRLASAVEDNIAPVRNIPAAREAAEAAQRTATDQAYTLANKAEIPYDDQIGRILSTLDTNPAYSGLLKSAEEIHMARAGAAQTAGEPMEGMFTTVTTPDGKQARWLTMEGFNSLKKALDTKTTQMFDAKMDGSAFGTVRDLLKNRLATLNPDYANALDIARGGFEARDAAQLGQTFTSGNPREFVHQFGKLSDPAKEVARTEAAGALDSIMLKKPNPSNSVLSNDMKMRIGAIAKSPEDAAQFLNRAELEAAMRRESDKALRGSQTADNFAADSLVNPSTIASAASGSPAAWANSLAGFMYRNANGLGEKSLTSLGDLLTTPVGVDGAANPAFGSMLTQIQESIAKSQAKDKLAASGERMLTRAASGKVADLRKKGEAERRGK